MRRLAVLLALTLAGCASQKDAATTTGAGTGTTTTQHGSDSVFVYTPPAPKKPARRTVAPIPPPVPDPVRPASGSTVSPGAPSDAEVRRELEQGLRLKRGFSITTLENSAELTPDGYAAAPPSAPDVVDAVIRGGNRVAHAPYVYGGGHGTFTDSAYDCSGSVSFALAAAGLIRSPMDSTSLSHWGAPGPGKWITIFANGGHAFMYVAGLRFDTSGRSGPLGSRWQTELRSTAGFVARHPPGL